MKPKRFLVKVMIFAESGDGTREGKGPKWEHTRKDFTMWIKARNRKEATQVGLEVVLGNELA